MQKRAPKPQKPLVPALADAVRAASPLVVACGGDPADAERVAVVLERANDRIGPIAFGIRDVLRGFRGAR